MFNLMLNVEHNSPNLKKNKNFYKFTWLFLKSINHNVIHKKLNTIFSVIQKKKMVEI
jgi:hypothetical protein